MPASGSPVPADRGTSDVRSVDRTTITAGDGSRQPSENELEGARFLGCHVAQVAAKLFA